MDIQIVLKRGEKNVGERKKKTEKIYVFLGGGVLHQTSIISD